MNFKPGDVVQLKSGGPKMTVLRIDGNDVVCTWFKDGSPAFYSFPPTSLDKVG